MQLSVKVGKSIQIIKCRGFVRRGRIFELDRGNTLRGMIYENQLWSASDGDTFQDWPKKLEPCKP